jgi:hypothetical protein
VAPLAGVLFVVLVVVSAIIVGETPDATEDTADEVLSFYQDNDDDVTVGALLWGLGAVALLFFAGWLRRLLRDAEGPRGILSAVAFAGAIVLAVGIASSAAFSFAVADVADSIEDPVVFQTLNALVWGYWLPFAAGVITFLVATGISVVRHGALPKWLGWIAIVAGVLFFSPAFIVGAPLAGLWVLVVSIMGAMRGRRGGAPSPPATTT